MEKTLDKIIIFICCMVFALGVDVNSYTVIPVMISIILSSCISYFDKPSASIFCYLLYVGGTFYFPMLLFFLPLFLYDLLIEPYKPVSLICVPSFFFHWKEFSLISLFLIAILTVFVYIVKKRTVTLLELKHEYILFHDHMTENIEKLNIKSKDLMERQEYEISNATLNERNRIAREIHDVVGHILSRSLLQIGALMAITPDGPIKEGLSDVKNTLSTGMDNIRESIHNLHEDSMNLEDKLNELIAEFSFCPVQFQYEISTDFSMKAKYTILLLVKEALSNIVKHSQATHALISITEIPAFYRIIIHDNGIGSSKVNMNRSAGMGVASYYDRIHELDGNINISNDNGYKIYITLPKETVTR